jgi:predicted TIM-barrel fold metal-dependent hydrolase
MSEGGISWVAGVMDRIDHLNARALPEQITVTSDIFRRNFWFCSLDEPSGFRTVDTIGVDNILIASDYPHSDGTWPDTQPSLKEQLSELTKEQQRKICWENGVKLFRHPAPVNPLP